MDLMTWLAQQPEYIRQRAAGTMLIFMALCVVGMIIIMTRWHE